MKFLLFVLILLCVIGAYILNRKAKAQGMANSPPAMALAVLALILISVRMVGCKGPSGSERAEVHIASFETAQATVTGRKVAERHPGGRVTVLLPPKSYGLYRATEHLDRLQDLLVKEMEAAGMQVQVKPVPLPPNPGDQQVHIDSDQELDPSSPENDMAIDVTQYFMSYYTTKRFSKIILDQSDADVVVSLFDLPMKIEGRQLPSKEAGPALVMMYDNVNELSSALSSTILDAVVLRQNTRQPWDYNQSLPKKPEQGFAKWFYWVTPETVDSISHPSL